jgi:hypothetical protein
MKIILLAFAAFGLMVVLMSIGVLFGRRAIQGSCGGINNIPGLQSDCSGSCSRPCPNKARRVNTGSDTTQADRQTNDNQ